jgi:hypothetical protein
MLSRSSCPTLHPGTQPYHKRGHPHRLLRCRRRQVSPCGHSTAVCSASWSLSSRHMLSACGGGVVHLWTPEQTEPTLTLPMTGSKSTGSAGSKSIRAQPGSASWRGPAPRQVLASASAVAPASKRTVPPRDALTAATPVPRAAAGAACAALLGMDRVIAVAIGPHLQLFWCVPCACARHTCAPPCSEHGIAGGMFRNLCTAMWSV